ncbi:MAG: hypothetical protein ACKVTZ_23545, partial [Bacteroidia bacterium]
MIKLSVLASKEHLILRGATQSNYTAYLNPTEAEGRENRYEMGAVINALGFTKGLEGYGFEDYSNGSNGWDGI